jgi:sialidase-1
LHYRFNLAWLTAGVAPQAPAGELQSYLGPSRFEQQPVFESQRFPNLVVNTDGSLLATWGAEQVMARRSEDGGHSWGAAITIADPGFHGGGTTVDTLTGDVLAFVEAQHPPAPLTVYRSRDFGQTWEAQAELRLAPNQLGHLPSMHMNEHGLTLRHGAYTGRLIRPSRYYSRGNDSAYWGEHYTNAIYSDDGGYSWQTSEPFPEFGTGEAAIAELSGGELYYNSRVHWPERPDHTRRRSARSLDGGASWGDWRLAAALPDGRQDRAYGCMGGLVRLPLAGRDVLIYSNLDTDRSVRERVTVWASFDGGQSWPIKRLVDPGPSAYSCLAAGRPGTPSDGWIYLHYESGRGSQVARFNLTWLLEGEPTGDGEVPPMPEAAQQAAAPVTDPIYISVTSPDRSQPLFVESDHLRVGIDLAIGGAVTHVSTGDGRI